MTIDRTLYERQRARVETTSGDPDAAPGRLSVPGTRRRREPLQISRPSGAGVLVPRYSGDEARLKIISTSPTLIEEEVDRRLRSFYTVDGVVQMPTNQAELDFRRKQVRDNVWRDINVINERNRGASVAAVGLGAIGFASETAYRPFAAVAGLLSGEDPRDSIHQAWEGLTGHDPFSKQGRNIGFVRLLPDEDILPFDLSVRDVVGGVADIGIDLALTGGLVKWSRSISAGARTGFPPTPQRAVADIPHIKEYVADLESNPSLREELISRIKSATGIDHSGVFRTEVGMMALGYKRAEIAAEGLSQVALAPLDSWSRRFTGRNAFGRNGWLFKTDRFGNLTNVARQTASPEDITRLSERVRNIASRLADDGGFDVPEAMRGEVDEVLEAATRLPPGEARRIRDQIAAAFDSVYERDVEVPIRVGDEVLPTTQRRLTSSTVTEFLDRFADTEPAHLASLAWNDVFSNPGRYNLTAEQRRYVDQVIELVDEVDQMRVRAGLPSRKKDTSPEGWFYVPRSVTELDDLVVNGQTNPSMLRKYEEMAEGIKNGVRYESDLRAVLDSHIRNAYHEVNLHRLNEAVRQFEINPARVQGGGEFARVRAPGAQEASDQLGGVMAQFRQTVRRIEALTDESNSRNLTSEMREQLADAERRLADAEFNLARMRAIDPEEAGVVPTRVVLDEQGNALDQLPSGLDPFDEARRVIDEALVDIVNIWRRTSGGLDLDALDAQIARAEELGGRATELRQIAAQTERIRVANWRGTWLPKDMADEMNRLIPAQGETMNFASRTMGAIGDTFRFNQAVGDFAAPFLQGYPVLMRHPLTWAKSAALSYQAFFDPTAMSRHIRDNIDVYQRMAQNGVPVGDNEFFAALRAGRNTNVFNIAQNMVRRLPENMADAPDRALGTLRNQSYGRFQATYDSFLAASRSMMWEGLETGWERRGGSLQDLARHIRNMTGGLDSRALGITANQRGIESTWLAFAPRYTRSVGALMAEMFDSNPAIRGEARRAMLQTFAGTTGMFIAAGLALGKDWEEITTSLDPREGKKFLSFQMGNGDWVGVGGTIRSMTQMIAASLALGEGVVTDPSSVLDLSLRDLFDADANPLLRFAEGRAAPGQTVLRAAIEWGSGGTVNALPYDEINDAVDMRNFLGTSLLPFAVQGVIEGESLRTATLAVGGLRTSPQTDSERKNAILDLGVRAAGFGSSFEEYAESRGENAARRDVRQWLAANDPQHLEEFDRIEAERIEQYRRDREIRRDPIAIAVLAGVEAREKITQVVAANPQDLKAIREEASRILRDARAVREQDFVQAALAGLPESDSEAQKDVDRYFDMLDIEVDSARDEAEAALRSELGPERWSRLLDNVFAVTQPMPEQWTRIQEGKRILTEEGFFELGDASWGMLRGFVLNSATSDDPAVNEARANVAAAKTFQGWYDAEVKRQQQTLIETEEMTPEAALNRAKNIAQRHPVTQAFDQFMLLNRVRWAQAHPEEATVAYELGYIQGSDQGTAISNVMPNRQFNLGEVGDPTQSPATTPTPRVETAALVEAWRSGASYRELSQQFGMSEEAIRSRLRREAGGRSPETLRE